MWPQTSQNGASPISSERWASSMLNGAVAPTAVGDEAGVLAGEVGQLLGRDLGQVGAAEVLQAEDAEDVVDDRGRHLHVRVPAHHPLRLEASEGEGIDE